MFCSKCGAELNGDCKFCSRCGNPINPPDIFLKGKSDSELTNPDSQNPRASKRLPKAVLPIVAAVLILTVFAVFLIKSMTKGPDRRNTGGKITNSSDTSPFSEITDTESDKSEAFTYASEKMHGTDNIQKAKDILLSSKLNNKAFVNTLTYCSKMSIAEKADDIDLVVDDSALVSYLNDNIEKGSTGSIGEDYNLIEVLTQPVPEQMLETVRTQMTNYAENDSNYPDCDDEKREAVRSILLDEINGYEEIYLLAIRYTDKSGEEQESDFDQGVYLIKSNGRYYIDFSSEITLCLAFSSYIGQ